MLTEQMLENRFANAGTDQAAIMPPKAAIENVEQSKAVSQDPVVLYIAEYDKLFNEVNEKLSDYDFVPEGYESRLHDKMCALEEMAMSTKAISVEGAFIHLALLNYQLETLEDELDAHESNKLRLVCRRLLFSALSVLTPSVGVDLKEIRASMFIGRRDNPWNEPEEKVKIA